VSAAPLLRGTRTMENPNMTPDELRTYEDAGRIRCRDRRPAHLSAAAYAVQLDPDLQAAHAI
jgi:hypothetical protein